jgi:hypothetical protein
MNPLIVLFFLAIFLEDYIFKEGKLVRYYFWAIIIYWVFYYFNQKSIYNSASKKLLMATYSQSYDPTIYGKLKLDTSKAREFIAKLETKIGKKISMTLFLTKIIGEVFSQYPECNQAIRFGMHANRGSIDIGVLVAVDDGKVNNLYK